MDDNETGYWWLRVLGTVHGIFGVILFVLAGLAVLVSVAVAARRDFYAALAPYFLLSAGGFAIGGVVMIGLGEAHKALADIADNSHCLPRLLAQLRGGAPAAEPDVTPIETPDFTPTGTHRPCPKCGYLVFATRPICSVCGTRVYFSRPA